MDGSTALPSSIPYSQQRAREHGGRPRAALSSRQTARFTAALRIGRTANGGRLANFNPSGRPRRPRDPPFSPFENRALTPQWRRTRNDAVHFEVRTINDYPDE